MSDNRKAVKGDYIKVVGTDKRYKDFNIYGGYYEVIASTEHYGVFIKGYNYLIPHDDYIVI